MRVCVCEDRWHLDPAKCAPEPKLTLAEGGVAASMVDLLNRKMGLVSYKIRHGQRKRFYLSNITRRLTLRGVSADLKVTADQIMDGYLGYASRCVLPFIIYRYAM